MAEHLNELGQLLLDYPGGLHVRDIAQRLGVNVRSVYRLRDSFRSVHGIWLEEHAHNPEVPRGYLRLPKQGLKVQVGLTQDELEAIRTALARVRHLTPLAQQAAAKLAKGHPAAMALDEESVVYSALADFYPQGLYERVVQAIRLRQVTELTYRNAKNQVKSYRFDPYALVARDPHLYLVGANHNSRAAGHDPIKELRLDQVQEFKITCEHFTRPPFDVQEYARSRFGAFAAEGEAVRVRVWFSPEKAGFVQRSLRHPSQVVHEQLDGSAVWEVTVPLSEDLVHFVVGYGPHARVLEPKELREQVVEWARGTLERNQVGEE